MAYSGVYIDGIKLQDIGIRVRLSSSEPLLSGTRNNSVIIPNRHGAYNFGGHLTPKLFTLNCVLTRSNYAEMKARITDIRRLLLDANGRPKTVKLRFEDEHERYYNVVVDGAIDIERVAELGVFTLPLLAHDPVAVSVMSNDEITWGSEVVVFLSDYKLGHTGSGSQTFIGAGTTTIEVTGDNVKPIIYVNGSGTNVTIGLNGKAMSLGTFTDASWVIDLAEYTAIRNGANAMHLITGDWLTMELARGTNTVTVGGTGLNVEVSFKYRDIWHG